MQVDGLTTQAPLGASPDAIVDAWVTAARKGGTRAYRVSIQTGRQDPDALELHCGIVYVAGWDYLVYVLPSELRDRATGPWLVHARPIDIDDFMDFELVATGVKLRLTLDSPLMAAEAKVVSGALVDLFAALTPSRLDWPRLSLTGDAFATYIDIKFNEELLSTEGMLDRAIFKVEEALAYHHRPFYKYLPFAVGYLLRHLVWPPQIILVDGELVPPRH